jgi:protein-tyrosine-phosphatase
MKYFEFVCSGNHGRSPLAECIAKQYLSKLEVRGYWAISSGTRVDETRQYRKDGVVYEDEFARRLLKIAARRKLFGLDRCSDILSKENSGSDETSFIRNSANRVLALFEEEEEMYRNEAMIRLHISTLLKLFPEQTKVNGDSVLIRGMGQEHVREIKKIFENSEFKPMIETLEKYAGEEETGFTGAWGHGLEDYMIVAERMKECVHKSLSKFLGKNL